MFANKTPAEHGKYCLFIMADHGGFKFITYVLAILWHIYSSLINMRCLHILPHIILNILNMPKDSQNICDELKPTMVCCAWPKQAIYFTVWYKHRFLQRTLSLL
jgi:hypothetical protein